jgi:UrcA family protein
MTKFFATLAAIATIATAIPAAAEPLPVASVTVSIADLDLSTAAGQRAFDARVNRAVVELCGEAADVDLAGLNAVRDCRAAKIAEAHGIGERRLAQRSNGDIQLASR